MKDAVPNYARSSAASNPFLKVLNEDFAGEVPEYHGSVPLSEMGREHWRAVWMSPMAQHFVAGDEGPLTRMVELADRIACHEDNSERYLVEVRQIEDRFGFSPLARRRLEWAMVKGKREGDYKVTDEVEARRSKRRLQLES